MREAKGWGGKRKGAGRNKQPGSGLPHRARPRLASRFPVHVTMKVVSDLPNLRAKPQLRLIEGAFRAGLGRRLNDHLGRHGRVFADRYHQRILKTPSETKHALSYVLQNRRKHCAQRRKWIPRRELDPCSSALSLKGGWKDVVPVPPSGEPTVGEPRTWLLHTGWKLRGRLRTAEVPARPPPRPFPAPRTRACACRRAA